MCVLITVLVVVSCVSCYGNVIGSVFLMLEYTTSVESDV